MAAEHGQNFKPPSVFCFIGLFLGFAIIQANRSFEGWLLMIVAGSFIFIAVMQILPELDITKNEQTPKVFWLRFAIVNFGLALGWLLMFLIALFEEDIKLLFK